MLLLMIICLWLSKALTSQISSYGNPTAVYGQDALLGCTAADPKGIAQVTWQMLGDKSPTIVATNSKRFGQEVAEPYKGKVVFSKVSLSSPSITVRNVTWEDESCYICVFHVYPDGSTQKQTCLTVEGISEVKTNVQPPSSECEGEDVKEVVFSCSATGKPAPTIQWTHSPGGSPSNQPETTTTTNSDNTFTSSSNITLQVPPCWSGHVECLLNKGMTGERRERINYTSVVGPWTETEKGKALSPAWVALIVCALFASCIAIVAAIKRKRLKDRRRNENVAHLAFQSH